MVQFFKGSQDPRDEAWGRFASALGGGIGKGVNTYFANKAINEVLNDEKLKDAPLSQRWEALSSAVSMHGENGQRVLQNILQGEMQREKEKQSKASEKAALEKETRLFEHQKQLQELKNKGKTTPLSTQPISKEQLDAIDKAHATPGYEDMTESKKYDTLIHNGVSTDNALKESTIRGQQATREQQGVEKAYDAQKNFINEITKSYKGFETEMKPKLLQMQHMKPEDIASPTQAVFLEALGIPLGALDDPSSELYNKLSQDLLKGLPETYGNKILRVEVENFLKTIPTLLNSPNGRRMIASNMLKLGEMKEVYYNAMRQEQMKYDDQNKPLPRDFEQRIFDQVKPQIDRINNEFVQMSEVKDVPSGTVPFFNPSGEIEFVPDKDVEWASKNGGRRIW